METLQFKTNIKCSGCVAKVTPALNETAGENNWKVDTENTNKILTIWVGNLTESEIKATVEKAGFKAEKV